MHSYIKNNNINNINKDVCVVGGMGDCCVGQDIVIVKKHEKLCVDLHGGLFVCFCVSLDTLKKPVMLQQEI